MNYQAGDYTIGFKYKCFVCDEVYAVFAPVEIEDGAEVLNFKDLVVMSNSFKEDESSPIEKVINYTNPITGKSHEGYN